MSGKKKADDQEVNAMSTEQAASALGVDAATLEDMDAKGLDWRGLLKQLVPVLIDWFVKNPPFGAGEGGGGTTLKK